MENESIEIMDVPTPVEVKKTESPLKQLSKQLFKHLLVYTAIFIGILSLFVFSSELIKMVKTVRPNFLPMVTETHLQNLSDFGYIVAVIVGITIFYKTQKINFFQTIFYRQKKMTLEYFAVFSIILFGCQFIFTQSAQLFESFLNGFGFSTQGAIEAATSGDDSFMLVIYASLVGPFVEELLIRGGVVYRLRHYGKIFSILISAMAFGLFHMNLIQGVFAFFVGILFAYIALEYSFLWAVFFHILNNFGFSLLVETGLPALLGVELADTVINMLLVITSCMSVVFLGLYRKEIMSYLKANRTPKGTYTVVFTTMVVWIYIVICLLVGLVGLQRL